jgi:hypothetical protein
MAPKKIKRFVEKGRCKDRKVLAEVDDSVPLDVILQTRTSLFTRKQWKASVGRREPEELRVHPLLIQKLRWGVRFCLICSLISLGRRSRQHLALPFQDVERTT